MITPITTANVTEAQIAACQFSVDETTGDRFYSVESQTTKGTFYQVRYFGEKRTLTCTCAAGQKGTSCWHKRAALAAAKFRKLEQKAVVTSVDDATLARVMSFKAKPVDPTAKAPGNNKPFSLLRK